MHEHVDQLIIQRLLKGDESAFNEVYNLFSGQIYQMAFGFLKSTEASREIVQETFISLWTSREKLDESGDLWLYLYVIAKRKSLDYLREVRKSEIMMDRLMLNIEELKNNTEEKIWADELQCITSNILCLLPRQQQIVYRLSREEGLSHSQIAQKLNISKNTVKNHIVQAVKRLKTKLSYYISIFIAIAFL